MKELVGKTIQGVRVSEDQHVLMFDTDNGVVAYETYGDCCSETWFADITGFAALIGGTVRSAEEIPLPEYNVEDGRGRQESDEAYGVKIITDKGYADIVYRNSSNGYYGGSIGLADMDHDTGMSKITDDWRA